MIDIHVRVEMLLSIVVCTYNNADSLRRTLGQLVVQLDGKDVELIVVNNNSSDHTEKIIATMISDGENIQYYVQPLQGLSHARNLGVAKSRGEYILFTDDDAEIKENWVSGYMQKIDQYKADCIFGRILAIWHKPQPWWYDSRYQGFFSVIDHGNEPFQVIDYKYPFFGKNFCVRKSIINDLGGFDPKLGRQGEVLLGGEEAVVFNYIVKSKKNMWYFPDLDVGHRLKDREYTVENIKRQHIAGAKVIIWMGTAEAQDLWMGRSRRILRWHVIYLIESLYAYFVAVLSRKKRDKFFHFLEVRRAFMVILLWLKGV